MTPAKREALRMMFGGRCAYCGEVLDDKFHREHVHPRYRGGSDSEENIWPACEKCNRFKSTFSIEQFRGELALQLERARRYSINFRMAEKFGLVKETAKPVVFWFEQYRKEQAA
jgi:hypothetical protein